MQIHVSRAPTGPRGFPLVGSLPKLRRNAPAFFLELMQQYGDVATFRLGMKRSFFVSHPSDIETILHLHQHKYSKGTVYQRIQPVLGNGLITSEGQYWRRQRQTIQPAFAAERIAAASPFMVEPIEELCQRWKRAAREREVIDVFDEMMRLTQRILFRLMFRRASDRDSAMAITAWGTVNDFIFSRVWRLMNWPLWVPLPENLMFRRSLRSLHQLVARLIADYRRVDQDSGDLISLLLAAQDVQSGSRLSDVQLRDEVMTILIAGTESTALSLTWTFYLLHQHREIEENLRSELQERLAQRIPVPSELPQLQFARMVIDESLRLYPPVWGIARTPHTDHELGGRRIPTGSLVFMSPYVTHRRPDFWNEPQAFQPQRFSPQQASRRPRCAYFPFGGGPRICIGKGLALLEATTVLATLLPRYRIHLIEGQKIEPQPHAALKPRFGIKARLESVCSG